MVESPSNPSVEPELDEAVHIYRQFMEEIKIRLNVIQDVLTALSANPEQPSGYLRAEFAFLQFRFVCELIALASLAAHKPYGAAEELMARGWNARLVLRELARLNADFFPRPIEIHRSDKGILIQPLEGGLTRRGLMRFYLKCGRLLHRGVAQHAFDGKVREYDLEMLNRWCKRVGETIGRHITMILNEGVVLIVQLTGGTDGSVSVAISKSQGPSLYVPPRKG